MMKLWKKKLLYIFFFSLFVNFNVYPNKAVRGCQVWGFFAEFLFTLNHLEWCNRNRKIPVIYWNEKFAYFSKYGFNGSFNAWEYYFEPVSNLKYNIGDHIYTQIYYDKDFTTLRNYWEYIKYLYLLPEDLRKNIKNVTNYNYSIHYKEPAYPYSHLHLYDPKFRNYVKQNLLDKYVRIKPIVQNKINNFYEENIKNKKTIGLHLRGKFLFNEVSYVPNDHLFNEANKYADQGYQFYIATDQIPLIEEAKQKLKGKVIYYNCFRTDKSTSPFQAQQNTPQQGEDVLVEAMLLSKCDHLIHTLSQVSTAVLYFNPTLKHTVFH